MPWKPGQSGNPTGKAKGTKNRATLLATTAMENGLQGIVESVIRAAQGGDMRAARLVIERLVPPAKSRPINITLPELTDIPACRAAQGAIVAAVACGNLLADDGEALAALVEGQRRAMETETLEARLLAIEEQLGKIR